MKVAVLMSTYNGAKYIREQIDSILAQKGNFEQDLWVRDDGSTDGTKDILKDYEDKNQLCWYSGENLGPAKSFLDLVHQCIGYDFYAFADQDDYWMPDKLNAAIESIGDNTGLQLYFANAKLVDSELNSLGRDVYKVSPCLDFETLCCAGGILGCTIVFNSALAKVVQSNELPKQLVMHDFYLSVLCSALGGSISCDLQPFIKYRQHGNNVIGVASGIVGTLRKRIGDMINSKENVSIAEQAGEIARLYGTQIKEDYLDWLKTISQYRDSIWKRIMLATSGKTKYMNSNMGINLRMTILLGNR